MSRPSEIANSLLHRYYNQKQEGLLPTSATPRPKRIQSVTSIQAAEKFRSFVVRDISTKVTRINDPSIHESQIRDLNDEINKLVNEKLSWEYRIKELGGPNYIIASKRALAKEASIRNYRYFGRAKELSDIRELIELKASSGAKAVGHLSSDKEILKYVEENKHKLDMDEYYGKLDDEDIEIEVPKDEYSFDPLNPPTMEEIEAILVEKKREELRKRIGLMQK